MLTGVSSPTKGTPPDEGVRLNIIIFADDTILASVFGSRRRDAVFVIWGGRFAVATSFDAGVRRCGKRDLCYAKTKQWVSYEGDDSALQNLSCGRFVNPEGLPAPAVFDSVYYPVYRL